MSLPSPKLDDRSFQDIVDDVKRQIGLRCPEWTEHNVSDPGVTLLELFAYMTETMLYRLNLVPEKNYIRFLELLGISLETPEPAKAELRFQLTRPIPDTRGGDEFEMTLPARKTIAATVRTESEDAIEFATDMDLRLVQPQLKYVVALARQGDLEQFVGARTLELGKKRPEKEGFQVYSPRPESGDAVYYGFAGQVAMNTVALNIECLTSAATGLNEGYPSQVWEIFEPAVGRWERLEVEDETKGYNRNGAVFIHMPVSARDFALGGRSAVWVRSRYTTDPGDLPARGIDELTPSEYERSPELISVEATVVGGTVQGSNSTSVYKEVLGVSDGLPGQTFRLRFSPVLTLRVDETILVGAPGESPDDYSAWTEWKLVEDFSDSGRDDHHFTIDYLTGEIAFGPNFAQPDGSGRTYGKIPEKGLTVVMSCYRHGGGTLGNVREGRVRNLKSPIPFVADVFNPRPATGGRDRETLDRAKLRAREKLMIRDRAVTAEDYEFLAQKASSSVGRARCIQATVLGSSDIRPGLVRVLLVPALSRDILVPKPSDLRVNQQTRHDVHAFLDERRLLTASLEVDEPDYRFVSVDLRLVADPRADANQVAHRVIESLNRYIHPLYGGPAGTGWPFKRSLTLADVYAQVGAVQGVAFLLDAKLAVSDLLSKEEGVLGTEVVVPNAEGIRLNENQLFATRQHTVRVVPMAMVGMDDNFGGS